MINQILNYIGAFLVFAWGLSHLFPTRNVVAGFGDISHDNRRIITMEWIIEGIALIFIGTLVSVVTFIDHTTLVSKSVFVVSAICLLVLALVSLFTGFRINFLPFRLCPIIFTTSAVLFLMATFL